MKIKKYFSNAYTRGTLLVIAGLFMGWLFFHHPHEEKTSQVQTANESKKTIWTCAMHPQIRMDHPGKCPICGMDLIPLEQSTSPINPDAIVMTDEAVKLAEVQTSIVSRERPMKEIRLYGKIQADERLVQTQPAHVPGRIEKLLVNYTGEEVRKGQAIAQIYSPEMITAQQELLEAVKMKELQPQILEAAREKLHQWKFTDSQIAEIEKNGTVKTVFDVFATVSGIVINRRVNVGDYVSQGAPLFEIADLSKVWALFDAYETDLPWIKKGDRISFTLQSQPGKEFTGIVSFIDPVINPQTRVARVRVEIPNSGNTLKPDMFATGVVKAHLTTLGNSLVIPQSAVLWTGTRSVVYVKIPNTEEPGFMMRKITLGASLSNSYVVLDGLKEGEEIVTNGTFSVDAAAQLAGKPSMMNTEDVKSSTSYNMSGMNMGGKETKAKNLSPAKSMNMEHGKVNVDIRFKEQLTALYKNYLTMKNAFITSDSKIVSNSAKEVEISLNMTDMKLLKGNAHVQWMEQEKILKDNIKKIVSSADIEVQRSAFAAFNLALYKTIKVFGINKGTVYYQYCPMAIGEKGAYWFSESGKIRNPYFGDEMLSCGETRETFKF